MCSRNMRAIVILAFICSSQICAEGRFESAVSTPPIVRSVTIRGTRLPVDLATQVGQPYNASVIEKGLRRLWGMGRFEEIRVETERQDDGTAVIFRVVEARVLRLHKLVIEPSNLGVRLMLPEGASVDRRRGQAVAEEARKQLNAQGYTNAQVGSELIPTAPNQADLHLQLTPGDRIQVTDIQFAGDIALDSKELHRALRALRIRRILGWPLFPAYSPEAVDAGLVRFLSLYLSKCYFDAKVRLEGTEIRDNHAEVRIRVEAGPLASRASSPATFALLFFEGAAKPSVKVSSISRPRCMSNARAMLGTPSQTSSPPRSAAARTVSDGSSSPAIVISLTRCYAAISYAMKASCWTDVYCARASAVCESNLFEPVDASQVVIHPSEASQRCSGCDRSAHGA